MGVKRGFIQREKHGLSVFENKMLRRVLVAKREEVKDIWKKLHMGSFIICTLNNILLG
jgi:hypothetical protein